MTQPVTSTQNATPHLPSFFFVQSAAGAIAPQVNLWDHWNLRYTLYTVYVSLIHKYYIYICIYIYMCMCICILLFTYASARIYIYIQSYIYIYIYTFKYITFILYIYIYIYVYIYTFIYIYICGTPPNVHRFCFTSGALALHGGAVRVMFFVRHQSGEESKQLPCPKGNIAPEPPTPERSFGVLKFTIPFNHRVSWLCKSHELNNHTPAEIPLKNHVPVMCSAETPKKHHVSCLNSHWNAPADIPVNHHFAWWNHR